MEAAEPTLPGSTPAPPFPGPFAVGRYAREFRDYLRKTSRVLLIGEVTNFSGLRASGVYFELRDGEGAMPCAVWRNVFEELGLPEDAIRDGTEVIVAGHPDFFPGSATSAARFSFRVTWMRPAGEGDLLARLDALRKQLAAEGLLEPQRRLPLPALPKRIGVITGADSAARADVLAGLERRSWRGEVVFAHPPVQGAGAGPKITSALTALAGIPGVETIIVARGGGSLLDLWAFCDEGLCRAVALLGVPVIAAVGHETDRTLIDDVAAVSCSTPTHAAEAAIRVDVAAERRRLGIDARKLSRCGSAAVTARARALVGFARFFSSQADAQRARLHQSIREIRAASARMLGDRRRETHRRGLVLSRKRTAMLETTVPAKRRSDIERLAATLAAHEPERVLARGYAIATADGGEVLASAEQARGARRFRVRFADDDVGVEVSDDG